MRIRHLLEAQEKLSGEDLIRIQNDDYDSQAEFMLPIMLKSVDRSHLTAEQAQWLKALDLWDKHDLSAQVEPSIYKSWYRTLKTEIFADEYSLPESKHFMPKDMRVAWMLKRVSENPEDSDAQWIDDKRTPEKETLPVIVTRAFENSWKKLAEDFGSNPQDWTWKKYINTKISHIAKLPGFGSPLLDMNGAPESVRGNQGWHGAVYKFVIELGPHLQAWMQVPGGNDGDPFAPDFERNVTDWSQGVMRKVEFYQNVADARARGATLVQFTPGGG